MRLLIALTLLMISLAGCAAQPQIVEKAVYIDKPCERADDYAAAKWIAVRWIAIAIDGADYAATPDIAALLGNLAALKPTERNNDDDK